MADTKAITHVSQLDGCMVKRYQVIILNLIFSLDLIDDQFRVTIGFEIFHTYLLSKLEATEHSIVLCHIIGIGFR